MEPQPAGTDPQKQANESMWMKIALWYMRTPVLKHINPAGIIGVLLVTLMIFIFPPEHCTCEAQIEDPALKKMASAGNRDVQKYQQQRDNVFICAAKRADLLKKLRMEKKRQDTLKHKTPKT